MHDHPAIAALLGQLNNPSLPGIDLSLARMEKLLAALKHPERRLPPVIHLAGTNGKGSTQAFLKAIYEAQGYRVHAYTSPHLVRFNERITIAGREITDEQLLPLLERVTEVARTIPVTFFEATTAVAFLAFSETEADIVLLETGLGGRLDATNVVANPRLTIITPIDFDHMEFLGDTLSAIATEKAGIMKRDTPCIFGAQPPEALTALTQKAEAIGAPYYACEKQWRFTQTDSEIQLHFGEKHLSLPNPGLIGPHQQHNAALAAAATQLADLPINEEAIHRGIRTASWPARLQMLRHGPLVEAWQGKGPVMLDGAHNPSAARILTGWLNGQQLKTALLCGMMARKDPISFLAPLVPHIRHLIAMPIPGEECHPPEIVAAAARSAGIAQVSTAADMEEAITLLTKEEAGILLATGSLFFAGWLLKNHG